MKEMADLEPNSPTSPHPLLLPLSQREEFDSRSVKEMADLEAALKKSRLDCETLLKDIERENTDVNIEGPGGSGLPPPPEQIYPEIPGITKFC